MGGGQLPPCPPVSNTPESTALASSKISKLKSRWIFLRQAATLMLGGCWHVGLPKAKTPDNRPKWQVIYHIQPFLAVYSCLCCHYDDDHEASLPAQDMQQAAISCFCTKDFQADRHHAEQNIIYRGK